MVSRVFMVIVLSGHGSWDSYSAIGRSEGWKIGRLEGRVDGLGLEGDCIVFGIGWLSGVTY